MRGETDMTLMSPLMVGKSDVSGLHQLDIETGKIVTEWKFDLFLIFRSCIIFGIHVIFGLVVSNDFMGWMHLEVADNTMWDAVDDEEFKRPSLAPSRKN